jgi:hypothetical protein
MPRHCLVSHTGLINFFLSLLSNHLHYVSEVFSTLWNVGDCAHVGEHGLPS